MLSGRNASAENARALGLVDALASPELLVEKAREMILHPGPRPLKQRALAWATNTWPVRQILAPMVRKQTAAKASPSHYPAPFALIETWRRGGSLGQRLNHEARAVAKLAQTPTARNLIRVFFLQEQLKGLGSGVAHEIAEAWCVGDDGGARAGHGLQDRKADGLVGRWEGAGHGATVETVEVTGGHAAGTANEVGDADVFDEGAQ